MWIVKLALVRPYTFVVMSLMLLIAGVGSTIRMPKDIFPAINEPAVTVLWQYPGFPAANMANEIVEWSEFITSQFVGDIKRMESRSIFGYSVMRLYFHPNVNIDRAVAQVTSVSQTILRRVPHGTSPPYVLVYDPSSVPVMLVALASETLTESQLFDFGQFTVRQALAPVQGAQLPLPWGGTPRAIMVDLDPVRMMAHGVTPNDINRAMLAQNVILPTGSIRVDRTEFMLQLNNSLPTMEMLNAVPIKNTNGNLVYMRDVANVRDGYQPQTNLVRFNGHKSVFLSVGKNGDVSTLNVISEAKEVLKTIPTPGDLKFAILFDQSLFVMGAIQGVVIEGMTAAGLTGLLILLFLGSWRGTVVVIMSIPICVFTSIFLLHTTGNTLNLMTLGGLALSVGILVDDATVTLENIHRHLDMGKNLIRAILDGSQEIAIPAFVSTLCICIVFLPVSLLTGPPRFLFVPMALAVLFAIATSYLLSRTLVPVLTHHLIRGEHHRAAEPDAPPKRPGFFRRIHLAFDAGFTALGVRYLSLLEWSLHHPKVVLGAFGTAVVLAALAIPSVGRDFFPPSDGSQLRLHVAAPTGTRIEETGVYFSRVEAAIRAVAGEDVDVIVDNIGIPQPNNIVLSDTVTVSSADGEIMVALKPDRKHSALEYQKRLRKVLPEQFPELTFYFQPADMQTQILNQGLPTPVDIKVFGMAKMEALYDIAKKIERRLLEVHGAVDVHIQQRMDQPALKITVDREKTAKMASEKHGVGDFSQIEIARNVLIEASSSVMVAPNFWTDPNSGHTYFLIVQSPLDKLRTMDDLANIPIRGSGDAQAQYLSNIAEVTRVQVPAEVGHTNVLPTFDVMANIQGVDAGTIAAAIGRIIADVSVDLPKGVVIEMAGQTRTMNLAFDQLGMGLAAAILLVYLILVINFQSWTDPFIIIMALPGAFCGVVVMMLLTKTTFSVPSLMGAIMTVGVATANSILVVSFAKEALRDGQTAIEAALSAGRARLRPVVMTVIAMVIGMIPMSLGLSEGGDQNAPLGRAVIGGMLFACIATLVLVPTIFSLMRRNWRPAPPLEGEELLLTGR